MSGITECPNCAKKGLGVPLKKEGDSMVCYLCDHSEKKQ